MSEIENRLKTRPLSLWLCLFVWCLVIERAAVTDATIAARLVGIAVCAFYFAQIARAIGMKIARKSVLHYWRPRSWGVEVTQELPLVFSPIGSVWLFFERRVRWLCFCWKWGGYACLQDPDDSRFAWQDAAAYKADITVEIGWLESLARTYGKPSGKLDRGALNARGLEVLDRVIRRLNKWDKEDGSIVPLLLRVGALMGGPQRTHSRHVVSADSCRQGVCEDCGEPFQRPHLIACQTVKDVWGDEEIETVYKADTAGLHTALNALASRRGDPSPRMYRRGSVPEVDAETGEAYYRTETDGEFRARLYAVGVNVYDNGGN